MNRRRLQAIGFLVGLAGLAVVVVASADDVDGTVLPSAPALLTAFGLAAVSIAAAGRAWVELLDAGERRRQVTGALYLSQLSKYLPAGGFLQAAGQVSMSAGDTTPVRRVAVAFPVAALETVVAGALLTAGLAFDGDLPLWGRLVAAAAPISVLLLHPRLLRRALALIGRVVRRAPDPTLIPGGAQIARSAAWAAVNMLATSAAYAVLVRDLDTTAAPTAITVAFAAAWVCGFLVLPLPSGLGVREALLVGLLPGVPSVVILAAALAHRLVTVAAEVAAVGANRLARR